MTEEPNDESALVDAFAARLRDAEPPPGADARERARRAMARRAVEPGASEQAPPTPDPGPLLRSLRTPLVPRWVRRVPSYVWAAAAMTALAWGVYRFVPARETAPPAARLETTLLDGGHRVVASTASQFRARAGETTEIELERGTALFVVRPLGGRGFVVRSGTHVARVVGTVFLVRAEPAFEVEVLEGEVDVDGRARRPDGEVSGWSPELVERGLQEARARQAQAEPEGAAPEALAEPLEAASSEPAASAAVSQTPAPRPAAPGLGAIRSSLAAQRYDRALAQVDVALSRAPRRSLLHQLRGDALRGLGRRSDALAAYRAAVTHGRGPQRAAAGLMGARLADQLGQRQEARELLADSGALAPSSPVRAVAQAFADELAP